MKHTQISERYSIGFLEAFEQKDLKELLKEVRVLRGVIQANSNIMLALSSYLVKNEDKATVLEPFISNSKFDVYWQNLMMLLAENHRLNLFSEIIAILERCILEELNIVKVTIKTAHELAAEMKDKMVDFIANKVNKTIESTFIVEPEVIGGFIAESDNFIVDSSVKRSLEQFRLSLIKM